MPPLTASSASEMQLIALSRHCFWRSFTESSSHTLLSVMNKSYNTFCNLSVPSPFAAEISTTLSKLLKISCLSRMPSQSLLFMQAIFLAEAFLQALIRLLSSSSRGMLLSKTAMIRSAEESFFTAFSMPAPSMMSSVSRIPAVSERRKTMSPRRTDSSTISLVVPAISVTMLLSQPLSRFIRVLLPTLGFPAITVSMPAFKMRVLSYARRIFSSSLRISESSAHILSSSTSGISSSG